MEKAIEVFVPGLPNIPGWQALQEKQRNWLLEHTSNAVSNFRQSGLKAIQCCAELALIQDYLEGTPLTFTNWIRSSFGEASERTAWRWLANYKELRGSSNDQAILYLAEQGITGLNNLGQREILLAVKKLPPPKPSDKKALEDWKDKVGETVRELRRKRRTKIVRLTEDDALRIGITTTLRLMREATLKTSAEQKAWLRRLMGYVMELRAIPGTVSIERAPLPTGFMPPRGRPRKSPAHFKALK